MSKNLLQKYPAPARKWSFVRAVDKGWSPQDTVKNPVCIREMITDCELYQRAQLPLSGLAPTCTQSNVQPPSVVPPDSTQSAASWLTEMAHVGAVRSLYLAHSAGGGYTVTLKVTLSGGQRVYRYGSLSCLSLLDDLLLRWIRKGYWTPDKL